MSFGFPHITRQQGCILAAVALGALMTTFYTRMISVSLGELRGVWGISVDEGSILAVVATSPQLLVAPALPWFLMAYGFRRILIPTACAFAVLSFFIPFFKGYDILLASHGLLGLLLGCFVTASILLVMKMLPPQWWVVAFAFFIVRVSFANNIGVSLSAFYTEYIGWQWIYWQSALIMFIYASLLHIGLPPDHGIDAMKKDIDFIGMALFCVGATLLYAGLDQGERLDWFGSGQIIAMIGGGSGLIIFFFIHEKFSSNAWAPISMLLKPNIISVILIIFLYITMVTANAMLITRFLGNIHYLKALQSGHVLLALVCIQLFVLPACIWLVRQIDPRLSCAIGFLAMSAAAGQGLLITSDWIGMNFLPMAIYFAFGHNLVFLSLIAICIGSFDLKSIAGILAYVQFARTIGPTVCAAIFTLMLRWREDLHFAMLSDRSEYSIINTYLHGGGKIENLKQIVSQTADVLATRDMFAIALGACATALIVLICTKSLRATPLSPNVFISEK